jgi:anti-anti-sigma factor
MISEFIVVELENAIVVRIQLERATLSKASIFKDTMDELIQSGKHKIILDCQNIAFMDSTFLGAIVVSLKKIRAVNGNLSLVFSDKSSVVFSMLETTKMLNIFEIYFSIEEAVNKLV